MSTVSVLLLASLFLGAVCIVLAIPLIRRRIPPNHLYGLRVPATLADARVWYEANTYAGKALLAYGVFVMVLGALVYLVPLPVWLSTLLWFVLVMCGLILVTVRSWRFANRLRKVYQARPDRERAA